MARLRERHPVPTQRKLMGVHYTPAPLADFLAGRLLIAADRHSAPLNRILDPACGDGALLMSLVAAIQRSREGENVEVVGVEADDRALAAARAALAPFHGVSSRFIVGDFLHERRAYDAQLEFWDSDSTGSEEQERFDVIIANPPYVRTQHIGAKKAQRLAETFDLSGRVDLYHAFLVASTHALRSGGILGIITSNRFLSTLGGRAIRTFLARQYDILEVIDLGDTKLFEAAVLPAIFVGRKRARNETPVRRTPHRARFIKIYSNVENAKARPTGTRSRGSLFEVLESGRSGCYRVPEGIFRLSRGRLPLNGDPGQVWALTTGPENRWLERLRAGSCGVFGDYCTVRVGIKTTADEVFIRSDWNDLAEGIRPESELLRPLLTHRVAKPWTAQVEQGTPTTILYPHEASESGRKPIEFSRFPQARAYLESHRARLESRRYVVEGGRRWYEIWVPQDPAGWAQPKIVFPDISAEPKFFLDRDGRLVNGDCYWFALNRGVADEMLYLLLGLANSTVLTRFHDLMFNNKLYSSRRRYITQYVQRYPCPRPDLAASKQLIAVVKRLVRESAQAPSPIGLPALQGEADRIVERAFGLTADGNDA